MNDEVCSFQLINANGEINVSGLKHFVKAVKLAECRNSYAVVSIIGPQSSGKSTLLNQLFRTNFREMDSSNGRSQTTKGIWLAKCVGIESTTVVMDLEGTDGSERGEDDTAFERQSALFALAVSDIVVINMWCHDIGRENAANKPLLRTIFKVMVGLFDPPRKTTLLFVIRDKTETPLKRLEAKLSEDIEKIWNAVRRPKKHERTPLSDFFRVEVTALSHYKYEKDEFEEQVEDLRQNFDRSTAPGGLAGDRQRVVPASGFSLSLQLIWKTIRENKDLDLPSLEVMVATVRCQEISDEKLRQFTADKCWKEIREAVKSGPVSGFGEKISSLIDSYLVKYDAEAMYFDEGVRLETRGQLECGALEHVRSAYEDILQHLRSKALDRFEDMLRETTESGEEFATAVRFLSKAVLFEFDIGCTDAKARQASWKPSKIRQDLQHRINKCAASLRASKLNEVRAYHEAKLAAALDGIGLSFENANEGTWTFIRRVLKRETESAICDSSTKLACFKLDNAAVDEMKQHFVDFGRNIVKNKSKTEAGRVLIHMKDRFEMVFSQDSDSMPRVWTGKEDIPSITKNARGEALKLLAVMAAIRLDVLLPDGIEETLFSSLGGAGIGSQGRRIVVDGDPLDSSTWKEVPPNLTLITPVECKTLWTQFMEETEHLITEAKSAQEEYLKIELRESSHGCFCCLR